MTDEAKLVRATERAAHAQRLINDEMLTEAFVKLEAEYTAAWRRSADAEIQTRERIYMAINILASVRAHLQQMLNNGKIAQQQLDELAARAERKKRFGVI